MNGSVPTAVIGEVATVQGGYSFKSQDWRESGIPVVKIGNVMDGYLDFGGCSYVSPEVAASAAGFHLEPGDMLIGMTGYVGRVARVTDSDVPALLNQRVGRFQLRKPERVIPAYLYRVLRMPEIRGEFEGLATGSAQPNLSAAQIEGVEIPLVTLEEQRRIAKLLRPIDERFGLARRQLSVLDELGETAFRWFLHGLR